MAKTDKDTLTFQDMRLDDVIDASILNSRRLFLNDAIDSETGGALIRKFWYLENKEPGKPITLIINSPGGEINAGFAIWDQIKMLTSPVTTIVTGLAASMGSVLSLCAAKNRRFATPNARFMIHQPLIGGVVKGQATDLEIHAREMLKMRAILVDIYAKATGKDPKKIEKDIDRDTWLSAQEALEYGLIDKIVTTHKDIPA